MTAECGDGRVRERWGDAARAEEDVEKVRLLAILLRIALQTSDGGF